MADDTDLDDTGELCPECGEPIDNCECDDDDLDEDGLLPGEDGYDYEDEDEETGEDED